MDPSFSLVTSRLNVTIAAPGTLYLGARFDWTTQVHRVILDGAFPFLTQERYDDQWAEYQGRGLAGEFGIDTPLGFDDCPVGEWFPKVGVGRLKRPDDKPYKFFRPYPIEPALFQATQPDASRLTLTAIETPYRGWGWTLSRTWSAEGATLSLQTSLENTGTHNLETEEYLHNFLNPGAGTVGPDWTLSREGKWDPPALFEKVDPESLLNFSGPAVGWTRTPTVPFFLSDRRAPAPRTWTLADRATGLWVSETASFDPARFHVWGVGHVVSPELYRSILVAPGEAQTWTRTWTFGRTTENGR
ncbi:MAG TPA: hypothetical protein VMB23_06520 [Spirochaetia bacterium]|nr:hypothetical protein [Spirochaetia bacterium]